MGVTVWTGDCREVLRTLESESVNCIVTSPPYYELRDYGHAQQIGLEETPEAFVAQLVGVFAEARRVLRDDGVIWVNLGDTYYSGNGQPTGEDAKSPARNWSRRHKRFCDTPGMGLPKKSLLGIPWRFALAMQQDGWTLRSEVIWARSSAFVEAAVADRPHRQHETVFLFSKSRRYIFDLAALPEQTVWHIEPRRGEREHNAAFPDELAERCIRSGCPAGGVVLDPFAGVGTTGLVADRYGRSAILIELNPKYAETARQRIAADAGMFGEVA